MSPPLSQSDITHRHVSTVAQNRQTKLWLKSWPFAFFETNVVTLKALRWKGTQLAALHPTHWLCKTIKSQGLLKSNKKMSAYETTRMLLWLCS